MRHIEDLGDWQISRERAEQVLLSAIEPALRYEIADPEVPQIRWQANQPIEMQALSQYRFLIQL